jgi:hypothetical protein
MLHPRPIEFNSELAITQWQWAAVSPQSAGKIPVSGLARGRGRCLPVTSTARPLGQDAPSLQLAQAMPRRHHDVASAPAPPGIMPTVATACPWSPRRHAAYKNAETHGNLIATFYTQAPAPARLNPAPFGRDDQPIDHLQTARKSARRVAGGVTSARPKADRDVITGRGVRENHMASAHVSIASPTPLPLKYQPSGARQTRPYGPNMLRCLANASWATAVPQMTSTLSGGRDISKLSLAKTRLGEGAMRNLHADHNVLTGQGIGAAMEHGCSAHLTPSQSQGKDLARMGMQRCEHTARCTPPCSQPLRNAATSKDWRARY